LGKLEAGAQAKMRTQEIKETVEFRAEKPSHECGSDLLGRKVR